MQNLEHADQPDNQERNADTEVDPTRRNLALTLFGALSVSGLLKGCAPGDTASAPASALDRDPEIAQLTQALNGSTNIEWFDNVASMRAFSIGSHTNYTAIVHGYASPGDGGGGIFVWSTTAAKDDGKAGTALYSGTIVNPLVSGAINPNPAAGWRRIYSGLRNVLWYGAVGDGSTPCLAQFQTALAAGMPVYVPAGGSFYRMEGPITVLAGGLVGEDTNGSGAIKMVTLRFENCTNSGQGAINVRLSGSANGRIRFEHIYVDASSWSASTGCLGYGFDIESPVVMRHVIVARFKKSNIWMHQDATMNGPYQSLLEGVRSYSSGAHGCLVGNGANTVTLINYIGAWNGCTSYGVVPTVAGTGDGLHVSMTSDGNSYPAYLPETLTIIGGDCSYNAGYGWNIDLVAHSQMQLGYAEGNLTKQVRVGSVVRTVVRMSQLGGGLAGFTDNLNYLAYNYQSAVYYGNKQVAPVDFFDFIGSATVDDETAVGSGVLQGDVRRNIYLSRTQDGQYLTYFAQNSTPDGTSVNSATEAVLSLRGYGTYGIGIGTGDRHLKVTHNWVRLPDQWLWANTPGWNASSIRMMRAAAAPTSGSYVVGDTVYNTAPSSGGFIGWVCTAAGSPGTWKGFGAIS